MGGFCQIQQVLFLEIWSFMTGFLINPTQRFQKTFCFENLAELLFFHTGIPLSQEIGSDLTSSSVHSLAGSWAARNSTAVFIAFVPESLRSKGQKMFSNSARKEMVRMSGPRWGDRHPFSS